MRALDLVRKINDGKMTLEEAAIALAQYTLEIFRVRGISAPECQRSSCPEALIRRAEAVLREHQGIWNAVGKRLRDKATSAGVRFYADPTNVRSGSTSAYWLYLRAMSELVDVERITKGWDGDKQLYPYRPKPLAMMV